MSKDRIYFIVGVDKPPDLSAHEIREYILDAVTTWSGQYRPPGGYDEGDPGDPRFGLGKRNWSVAFSRARRL